MDASTRQRLIRAGRTLFALATVVAVVFVVRDDVGQLTEVDFSLNPAWTVLGILVAVLGTAQLPLAFRQLLQAQGQPRLTAPTARRLWWRSQVARFLPTGMAGIAARVVMAGDLGLSKRAASAAMGQEIAQLLGWSVFVGGLTVAATGIAPRWLGVLAVVGAVVGLAALPYVLRLLDQRAGLTTYVNVARRATFRYGVVVFLKAGRAGLIAVAATEVTGAPVWAVIAADAVGQVAGTLSIAPSGLGTREAAFIALAGPAVGVGQAISLAVILRVVDLGVELGWVAKVTVRRWQRADTDAGSRPPRVLHLTSSYPRHENDHVAPFLLDLTAVQREAGWGVTVVATHDAGLPTRHQIRGVPVRRFRYAPDAYEVLAYRGGGHAKLQKRWHVLLLPGLVLSESLALLGEVRRTRPDVVVAHWLAPSGIVAALFAGRSARTILTLHGNDVALADKLGPVARWAFRRADGVACISDDLAREAERVLRLGPGEVSVTRVPLPDDMTPSPLPDGVPRILAAGRASVEKGFDVLLDALATPELAEWRCTLVTDGPQRPELERRAAALGGRVTMLDAVPRQELFDLIRGHHVVAVPSRREGLGLFALECLALGRQVVASDVGGLPEVVRDDGDGVLVPPGDADALARALASLQLRPPEDPAAVRAHRPGPVLQELTSAYGVAQFLARADDAPHTDRHVDESGAVGAHLPTSE